MDVVDVSSIDVAGLARESDGKKRRSDGCGEWRSESAIVVVVVVVENEKRVVGGGGREAIVFFSAVTPLSPSLLDDLYGGHIGGVCDGIYIERWRRRWR